MLNIFPNGFNRGPFILMFFKRFSGPIQYIGIICINIETQRARCCCGTLAF